MSAALDRLIRTVEVIPLDERAAEEAARIRADLESRGIPIGPIDTEIAGIARACRATLVTRNLREFGRIDALSLDDWY